MRYNRSIGYYRMNGGLTMKKVTNVFCSLKTGSECSCNCTCSTCRNWLGKYNSGLADYFLEQLKAQPDLIDAYQATKVGAWHTDKSLAAQIYLKEDGPQE